MLPPGVEKAGAGELVLQDEALPGVGVDTLPRCTVGEASGGRAVEAGVGASGQMWPRPAGLSVSLVLTSWARKWREPGPGSARRSESWHLRAPAPTWGQAVLGTEGRASSSAPVGVAEGSARWSGGHFTGHTCISITWCTCPQCRAATAPRSWGNKLSEL